MQDDLTPQQLRYEYNKILQRPQTYIECLSNDELFQIHKFVELLLDKQLEFAVQRLNNTPIEKVTESTLELYLSQSQNYREGIEVKAILDDALRNRTNGNSQPIQKFSISDIYRRQLQKEEPLKHHILEELAKFTTQKDKIKYLKLQKIKYLQERTPETMESSGWVGISGLDGELFLDGWISLEIDKLQILNDDDEDNLVDTGIKEKGAIEKNSSSQTLQLPEIALLYYYNKLPILDPRSQSDKTANSIAARYGFIRPTSGLQLYEHYQKYKSKSNRTNIESVKSIKNMLKRLNNILALVTDKLEIEQEINILESKL